jgi:hypothetical protein
MNLFKYFEQMQEPVGNRIRQLADAEERTAEFTEEKSLASRH